MADEGEEDDERRRSVRARTERIRAERRRRIGENAKSRMEKVMSMQQRFSVEGGGEKAEEEVERSSVEVRESTEHSSDPAHDSTATAEDPPDELVELPPQPEYSPPAIPHQPQGPSLLTRWAGAVQNMRRTRLCLALLVPLLWVATGNNSCFTVFATSELCLLLWGLVVALTNRGTPHQPQLLGTLGMVKAALGLMYPQMSRAVDTLHQSCIIILSLLQDLCVSVFALVVTVALSHCISSFSSSITNSDIH